MTAVTNIPWRPATRPTAQAQDQVAPTAGAPAGTLSPTSFLHHRIPRKPPASPSSPSPEGSPRPPSSADVAGGGEFEFDFEGMTYLPRRSDSGQSSNNGSSSNGWYAKSRVMSLESSADSQKMWTPPSTPPRPGDSQSFRPSTGSSVQTSSSLAHDAPLQRSSSSLAAARGLRHHAGGNNGDGNGNGSGSGMGGHLERKASCQPSESSSSSSSISLYATPRPPSAVPPSPKFLSSPTRDTTHPRASTISATSIATSNSSVQARPHVPTNSINGSSGALSDIDQTAALINSLYARLDRLGVPGDGWDEGKERSRDGIINRAEMAGGVEIRPNRRGELMDPGGRDSMVLPAKEEQILRRVDRYGFFSSSHPAALASQHNRLATLSAAPYAILAGSSKKPPKTSARIPTPPSDEPPRRLAHRSSSSSLLPTLSTADMELETKRIDKWADMLVPSTRDAGGNVMEWTVAQGWWDGRRDGTGKYRKLQRRVFKGVPDRWRRAVWGLELEKMAEEAPGRGRVQSLEALQAEYQVLLTTPSSQDVQIDLDVPRTISGNVLFHTRYGAGQRALFHVLHAFGLHCDDIGGYCQGMGPIAATLLCYFEPERAYACLVRLFYHYDLRHIYEPGFPGLLQAFYIQERLVELLMPDVHEAFRAYSISSSSYATRWYITLFSNSLPFSTQLRLWDGLLLEGVDFLIVSAVSVIWCFRAQFTAPDASFESILSALSSYFLVESDDALLRWIRKALRRPELRKKMSGWREEWQGFERDGSAGAKVT